MLKYVLFLLMLILLLLYYNEYILKIFIENRLYLILINIILYKFIDIYL